MPTSAELTPRQRELIAAYRASDLSVQEILISHGATRSELDTALSKGREPFRRPASAKPSRNLRRRAPFDISAMTDAEEARLLTRRLARLLSERIADLEDRTAPGRSADPEGVAKALALNVRTLATLRRTAADQDQGGPTDHDRIDAPGDDEPVRSLAALRDELYGHLLRIHDESRLAGGAGAAEAEQDRDGGAAPPLVGLLPGQAAPADG